MSSVINRGGWPVNNPADAASWRESVDTSIPMYRSGDIGRSQVVAKIRSLLDSAAFDGWAQAQADIGPGLDEDRVLTWLWGREKDVVRPVFSQHKLYEEALETIQRQDMLAGHVKLKNQLYRRPKATARPPVASTKSTAKVSPDKIRDPGAHRGTRTPPPARPVPDNPAIAPSAPHTEATYGPVPGPPLAANRVASKPAASSPVETPPEAYPREAPKPKPRPSGPAGRAIDRLYQYKKSYADWSVGPLEKFVPTLVRKTKWAGRDQYGGLPFVDVASELPPQTKRVAWLSREGKKGIAVGIPADSWGPFAASMFTRISQDTIEARGVVRTRTEGGEVVRWDYDDWATGKPPVVAGSGNGKAKIRNAPAGQPRGDGKAPIVAWDYDDFADTEPPSDEERAAAGLVEQAKPAGTAVAIAGLGYMLLRGLL